MSKETTKGLPDKTEVTITLKIDGKEYALAGTIKDREAMGLAAERTIEHLHKYGKVKYEYGKGYE